MHIKGGNEKGAKSARSFMSEMIMSDIGFGPDNNGHIVNLPGNVDVHRTAV